MKPEPNIHNQAALNGYPFHNIQPESDSHDQAALDDSPIHHVQPEPDVNNQAIEFIGQHKPDVPDQTEFVDFSDEKPQSHVILWTKKTQNHLIL